MAVALHAEWTKWRTLPGRAWLILGIIAVTAGVSYAAIASQHCPAVGGCIPDPVRQSLLGIVVFVLGWLLTRGGLLPVSVADWILRLTPAAAYAVQQSIPSYSFVPANYTPGNGFYPLAPWAGFAVLCLWAAAALGLTIYVTNRRDV